MFDNEKDFDMNDRLLDDRALDILFRGARTYNGWLDKDVSDDMLRKIYDLTKMGPTSANCSPARFIFVKTPEAKERLKPHLAPGNVDKTMSAPVTAIVAYDMKFYDQLPKLFPHVNARSWFVGNDKLINDTAFRNATLQCGYMMMAIRALGLDCGAMSGFNAEGIKGEFFADQPDFEPDLLINIGYGDPSGIFDRSPRFEFDEVNTIV